MISVRTLAAALALAFPVAAMAATPIVVHRDPGCGCCEKWAAQVRAQFGRQVQIVDDAGRAKFSRRAGVPATSANAGTGLVTTAPAATKQYSPSSLPHTMVALAPIDAPRRTIV